MPRPVAGRFDPLTRRPLPGIIRSSGLSQRVSRHPNRSMKKPLFALLAALPLCASAIDTPPPGFPEAKIETPPLSLLENSLQGLPSYLNGFRIEVQRPTEGSRLYSTMPILVPSGDPDPKMVKAPDASVDYKLTIKNPLDYPSK